MGVAGIPANSRARFHAAAPVAGESTLDMVVAERGVLHQDPPRCPHHLIALVTCGPVQGYHFKTYNCAHRGITLPPLLPLTPLATHSDPLDQIVTEFM